MSKSRKMWRYRVTKAWGTMEDQCKPGDVLVDDYRPGKERTWEIDRRGKIVGGVTGTRFEQVLIKDGKVVEVLKKV